MLKTYMIHYTPLIDRKKFFEEELAKQQVQYECITSHDKENLTDKDISKFKSSLNKKFISNFLKHLSAIEKISRSNNEINLIIEDDVILCDNFKEKMFKYYNELPSDFDFMFLGGEPGKQWDVPSHMIQPNKNCYKNPRFFTKTLDAYIINVKTAENVINYYNQTPNNSLHIETDHWLNQYMKQHNSKVYWCYPRLVEHGSAIKFFKSSLR